VSLTARRAKEKLSKKMLKFFRKKKAKNPGRVEPSLHPEPEAGSSPDREKIGWVSPEYRVSRRVALDPATLEENRCVSFFSGAPGLEFYRVLRSRILGPATGRGNAIMITSALPGEGKTLTAINLAFSIAREFQQTVLLVDCDFRNQAVQEYLGLASDRGLIDYLVDNRPLSEIMIWPGVEKVTVISGGRTVQESSELLGSPRMKELVAGMKRRYPDRYILFDLPPVLTGADALVFSSQVDHIILVVEAGRTAREEIRRALGLLPQEKILGLVLNRQEWRSNSKYESKYAGA
jgi:non-specific protein-tyrosine kinase